MNIDTAVNLDDLRQLAKRKLPKIAFDFIDGGTDDERGLARNREAFQRYKLIPRYLVDVSHRNQSVKLLGRTYASPFGISPTGMGGLFRANADLMLAEAAAAANIPYLMSSASNGSIEAAMEVAPHNTWFQLYCTQDERINEDMVRRARDLGVETLVITVDVPVAANRERDRRNGFSRPLKLSARTVLDGLGHPAWLVRYLMNGGIPVLGNWAPYAPKGASAGQVADLYGSLTPTPTVTWKTVERMRAAWQGNLALKGILHPDDALQAVNLGVNAIIVSNHGGRQLDAAPAPLEMLPVIRAAVGDRLELILDSGVRRGSDIIIGMCLGARFTIFGRPTLYGAAAAGRKGIQKAIDIVRKEIDKVMAQIGCTELASLQPGYLHASATTARGIGQGRAAEVIPRDRRND